MKSIIVLKSCGLTVLKWVARQCLTTGFKHNRSLVKSGQWYKADSYAPRPGFNTTIKTLLSHSAYDKIQSVKNQISSFVHRPYYYNYYVFKLRNNNHEA